MAEGQGLIWDELTAEEKEGVVNPMVEVYAHDYAKPGTTQPLTFMPRKEDGTPDIEEFSMVVPKSLCIDKVTLEVAPTATGNGPDQLRLAQDLRHTPRKALGIEHETAEMSRTSGSPRLESTYITPDSASPRPRGRSGLPATSAKSRKIYDMPAVPIDPALSIPRRLTSLPPLGPSLVGLDPDLAVA